MDPFLFRPFDVYYIGWQKYLDTYHRKLWRPYVCVLYETHWNFTSTVTKHDCHGYISQIKNRTEHAYRSYKTCTASICLVKNYYTYRMNSHLKHIISIKNMISSYRAFSLYLLTAGPRERFHPTFKLARVNDILIVNGIIHANTGLANTGCV